MMLTVRLSLDEAIGARLLLTRVNPCGSVSRRRKTQMLELHRALWYNRVWT